MGGTLSHPGGQEGDHAYRARILSEQLNDSRREIGSPPVHVVAYERRGTGTMRTIFDLGARRSVQPHNRYATTARGTAKVLRDITDELQPQRRFIFGASAAGTEAIMIATSSPDILPLDGVAVYDPIGTRLTSWQGGFNDWRNHQLHAEPQKPEEMQNHNGQQLSTIGSFVASVANLVRTMPEMSRYGNAWRRPTTTERLHLLTRDERYGHMALLVVYPGHSFTNSLEENEREVLGLQSDAVRSRRPGPTEFRVEPEHYHSRTDDPMKVVGYVTELLAMAPAPTEP